MLSGITLRLRVTEAARKLANIRSCAETNQPDIRTMCEAKPMNTRIVCVGDVHGQWDGRDNEALKALSPDVVVFVGDFGNEDVPLVSEVNKCSYPSLVMLGNHDAWTCLKTRSARLTAPWPKDGDDSKPDPAEKVRAQIVLNGERNLAWNCKPVLGKPGGSRWEDVDEFYANMYGCESFEDSASRVVTACSQAAESSSLVLIGHNGPLGLGSNAADPCGADFLSDAGDWGDPDSAAVLKTLRSQNRMPALFVFGHMHDQLREGMGTRRMVVLEHGTLFVNTAFVPRRASVEGVTRHQFTVCDLVGDKKPCVQSVRSVWLAKDSGDGIDESEYRVVADQELFKSNGDGTVNVYDSHLQKWDTKKLLDCKDGL